MADKSLLIHNRNIHVVKSCETKLRLRLMLPDCFRLGRVVYTPGVTVSNVSANMAVAVYRKLR